MITRVDCRCQRCRCLRDKREPCSVVNNNVHCSCMYCNPINNHKVFHNCGPYEARLFGTSNEKMLAKGRDGSLRSMAMEASYERVKTSEPRITSIVLALWISLYFAITLRRFYDMGFYPQTPSEIIRQLVDIVVVKEEYHLVFQFRWRLLCSQLNCKEVVLGWRWCEKSGKTWNVKRLRSVPEPQSHVSQSNCDNSG
jgi:hypothetical protein